MKKILFPILALLVLAASGCQQKETAAPIVPEVKIVTLENIPWGGSDGFTVDITSNVDLVAEIPAADSWYKYLGMEMTSRSSGARSLVFTAEENEVKAERSSRIRLLVKATGEEAAAFDLTQDPGEDVVFSVEDPGEVSAAGGDLLLTVACNVLFDARSDASWLKVGTTTASSVVLTAEANTSLDSRAATVSFIYRKNGTRLGELQIVQKSRPSTAVSLERVWGKYTLTDTDWYTSLGMTAGGNQDRNIAMDDDYIYMPIIQNSNPDTRWGIVVMDHEGNYVKTLRDESGITKENSLWAVSDVQVLDNGGKTVLVACNMSRKQNNAILNLYAWEDLDAAPQTVTYSFADTHSDSRFGDKMTVNGDWTSGEIVFLDYFSGGARRNVLIFPIENGKIGDTPVDTTLGDLAGGLSTLGSLKGIGQGWYLFFGGYTGGTPTEFFSRLYRRTGDAFDASEYNLTAARGFDPVMQGVQLFTFHDRKIMAWISMDESGSNHTTYLKAVLMEGETYADAIMDLSADDLAGATVMPLAHPTDITVKVTGNGNRAGDMALRQIGDDVYLAVVGTGAGLSLFKVDLR